MEINCDRCAIGNCRNEAESILHHHLEKCLDQSSLLKRKNHCQWILYMWNVSIFRRCNCLFQIIFNDNIGNNTTAVNRREVLISFENPTAKHVLQFMDVINCHQINWNNFVIRKMSIGGQNTFESSLRRLQIIIITGAHQPTI